MKKKIFLLIAISLLTFPIYAQQGFHLGLGGNFNTVWIINQDAYGLAEYQYKLDLGGGAGVVMGYNFTNHVGLQAEIKTSSQGQKYEDEVNKSLTRQVKLNYWSVPILFKFIGGEDLVKFYADAGVQINLLNKAKLVGNYGTPINIDAKDRFTSSDIGLNFGLGADITLTDYIYLNAGMSFSYSFSDINAPDWRKHNLKGIYDPSRNATGGISVGIHYLFQSNSGYY